MTMATGGNGWYKLHAKGWVESDNETDNPQEVRSCIFYLCEGAYCTERYS